MRGKFGLIAGCAAAFAFVCLPGIAWAGASTTYSAYEGKPQIKTGEGGTRVNRNGIDYWTSGEPPRQYQVIGMIQDKRDEAAEMVRAIGSPSIARKVKGAGGDAVIVQTQEESGSSGGIGVANSSWGWALSGGSNTITRMLVVKYLPEQVGEHDTNRAQPKGP